MKSCEYCGAILRDEGSLENHLALRHPNGKDAGVFKCSHCDYKTTTINGVMTHHGWVHRGRPSLKCLCCGKKLKCQKELKAHYAYHHPEFSLGEVTE